MPLEPPSEFTSPHTVRCQIAFLTTFLNFARPTNDKSYNRKYGRKAGVWHATSFILATGDGRTDRVGTEVVAVTGRTTRQEISALLYRNVSQHADASRTSLGPFSSPFEGRSRDGLEFMRRIMSGTQKDFAVKFEQHVQDVVNVAEFFVKISPDAVKPIYRTYLLAFIAHRCCVKLAFRIETGERMWRLGQHPTAFIHSKLTDPDTKLHIPLDTVVPMPRTMQPDLQNGGLFVDPSSRPSVTKGYDSYPVTRENAPKWAKLLWQSVDAMDGVLKKVKEGNATPQLFLDFDCAISLLKFLVRSGVLKHIVAGSTKDDLEKARTGVKCSDLETIIRESRKGDNRTSGQDDDALASGVEPSRLKEDESFLEWDEYAAEVSLDDGEKDDDLVRYLKTLYIPDDIADVFMKLSSPTDPPHVTAVLVDALAPLDDRARVKAVPADDGPSMTLDDAFIDSLRKDIEAVLKKKNFKVESNRIQEALNKAVEGVKKASVHAESALMAHALSMHENTSSVTPLGGQSTEASNLVTEILQDEEIAIGVSKRSCFCCDLLAELIAGRESSNLKFALPGTHSTIYPWYPPPGLPIDMLQAIKVRLIESMKKVVETAIDIEASSTHTTPLHSAVEASELEPTLEDYLSDLS